MAKKAENEQEQEAPSLDKTPQQALNDDWPTRHNQLAPYITVRGEMRSGLKPSEQAKAREILESYGF